ncbi:hypothetical protein B4099_1217 [Heyndrickxia coagulans]|uniref:Uncharacterized protein n=1 Tax=Heyndrickxia coagulans TaxID=1398 RepID=A0A150KEC8_HEYCO|nr:hypothetical protein B4099_1217 [Heyndrickxia coagulans]
MTRVKDPDGNGNGSDKNNFNGRPPAGLLAGERHGFTAGSSAFFIFQRALAKMLYPLKL